MASRDAYDAWTAQVRAAFAPYRDTRDIPSDDSSSLSTVSAPSAISAGSATMLNTVGSSHQQQSQSSDLSCFYAQMLLGLYQHRSVSNPATPRERSVENVAADVPSTRNQERLEGTLTYRLERHARALIAEQEREQLQKELHSGIVEEQNRQLASELTEMLQYARNHNRASAVLRERWEETRQVRQQLKRIELEE